MKMNFSQKREEQKPQNIRKLNQINHFNLNSIAFNPVNRLEKAYGAFNGEGV
jgi:hypothetical protein